jgi:hypothetical protein
MTADETGRDGEVEAFVVDRYLDSILSRRPVDLEHEMPDELAATAIRLAHELPRYHPSFRFEEDLAARLAAIAGRAGDGMIVPFPTRDRSLGMGSPWHAGRATVVGGVLTSAALSVAGALFVAWRMRRPTDDGIAGRVRAAVGGRIA